MSAGSSISLVTTLVTALFAGMVLWRYFVRPRAYLLSWGVGLALYSIGTLCQVILATGWNEYIFKLWYWGGALMVASLIGQGTVFLLVKRKRLAWGSFWAIAVLGLIGLVLVFSSAVDSSRFRPEVDLTEQYRTIFTASGLALVLRQGLTILLNTYGTLLLVGGALYSAYLLWRKAIMPGRMLGNLLIGIGGALPALSGYLILLGAPEYKYYGQLFGGILLFTGFLLATVSAPRPLPEVKPAQQPARHT